MSANIRSLLIHLQLSIGYTTKVGKRLANCTPWETLANGTAIELKLAKHHNIDWGVNFFIWFTYPDMFSCKGLPPPVLYGSRHMTLKVSL